MYHSYLSNQKMRSNIFVTKRNPERITEKEVWGHSAIFNDLTSLKITFFRSCFLISVLFSANSGSLTSAWNFLSVIEAFSQFNFEEQFDNPGHVTFHIFKPSCPCFFVSFLYFSDEGRFSLFVQQSLRFQSNKVIKLQCKRLQAC